MLNRCPHILEDFGPRPAEPTATQLFDSAIPRYLAILNSKHVSTSASLVYEALCAYQSSHWLRACLDDSSKLRAIRLTWWEAPFQHTQVDGETYFRDWEANYAARADNWDEVSSEPSNIERLRAQVELCVAGLVYVKDYEDALFATLRDQQPRFPRLSPDEHPRMPPEENRDKYGGLVEDITAFMVSLGYPGGVGFLGGLSGAYVLSCPASYTLQLEDPIYSSVADHYRPRGFTEEEVHMMVLLRYLWAVGSQELARAASDALPLRFMQRAGQPWSFTIELPAPPRSAGPQLPRLPARPLETIQEATRAVARALRRRLG